MFSFKEYLTPAQRLSSSAAIERRPLVKDYNPTMHRDFWQRFLSTWEGKEGFGHKQMSSALMSGLRRRWPWRVGWI